MRQLLLLIVAAAPVFCQANETPPDPPLQLFQKLVEELRQVKLELAAHRLIFHEARSRDLEKNIAAAASERRKIQQQDAAAREDLLKTEAQLIRPELDPEERAALQEIRNNLITDSSEHVRQQASLLTQHESELRGRLEQERLQVAALRRQLHELSHASN